MKGKIKKQGTKKSRGKSAIASPRDFAYAIKRMRARKKRGAGVPFACSCSSCLGS
jgi:hypothetical protein